MEQLKSMRPDKAKKRVREVLAKYKKVVQEELEKEEPEHFSEDLELKEQLEENQRRKMEGLPPNKIESTQKGQKLYERFKAIESPDLLLNDL